MAMSKNSKNNKRKGKISRKNNRSITLALIITVILFVVIIARILDALIFADETYDISGNSYYQYFYGIKEEYSGNMEVVITDDDLIKLTLEDEQIIYLDSTPIYYADTLGKVLLAEEFELVIPDEGNYKISRFSSITEKNNIMYLNKYDKDKTAALENAFLFDGSDLYLFLDDTTISIGSEQYEVSAFSYAIVNYRENVEIYNYENDDYIIIQDEELLGSDVLAVNNAKQYTINMSLDTLSTPQSEILLITNLNNLEEYSIN